MPGKFVLNRSGVAKLLRDADLSEDLAARAKRIAHAAGGETVGFSSDVTSARTRSIATVWTTTAEAIVAESAHAQLSRSVDAGRGDSHD